MKQTFINSTSEQIRYTEKKIESNKEKLSENFIYYLSWCAKDIYCDSIRVQEYKRWLTRLEEVSDFGYFLHSELEKYDDWLSSEYNVCIESTNAVSELCVTWKYQVIVELRKMLKVFGKQSK